jgi:hypothetical protein
MNKDILIGLGAKTSDLRSNHRRVRAGKVEGLLLYTVSLLWQRRGATGSRTVGILRCSGLASNRSAND